MSGYRLTALLFRWVWLLCGPVLWERLWVPAIESSNERRRQRRRAAFA